MAVINRNRFLRGHSHYQKAHGNTVIVMGLDFAATQSLAMRITFDNKKIVAFYDFHAIGVKSVCHGAQSI